MPWMEAKMMLGGVEMMMTWQRKAYGRNVQEEDVLDFGHEFVDGELAVCKVLFV